MKRTASVAMLLLCLGACSDPAPDTFQGYVEGDYVRIAAPAGGVLLEVGVVRGQQVEAGALLFRLEAGREEAQRAEAGARLQVAQARVADLSKGQRAEELDVVRAQQQQARAQLTLAEAQLARQKEMRARGLASAEALDQARTQRQGAQARVQELDAALRAAELSARDDALRAAAGEAQAAEAAVAQAQWHLDQRRQVAAAAGVVEDVYFRTGEWVGAGVPVVSLLPPANRRIRFFVPETVVGALKAGQGVRARCDGCAGPIAARISFIASAAEFTPPVIYSRDQRERLVFLVEAVPDAAAAPGLHPGQPVDVSLAP